MFPTHHKQNLDGLSIAELEAQHAQVVSDEAAERVQAEAERDRARTELAPQLEVVRKLAQALESVAGLDLSHFDRGVNKKAEDAFAGLRWLRDGVRGAALLEQTLEAEMNLPIALVNGPIFYHQVIELRNEIEKRKREQAATEAAEDERLDRAFARRGLV